MATPRSQMDQTLYNQPALSDVKVTQTFKSSKREYHAHKAILCSQSKYFLRAFTGNFKEATSAVMELHDDDPDHFEFAMKFVYTEPYDVQAIQKMAGNDKLKRVLIPIGVHAVADKYDIVRLYEPAAQDFVSVFRNTPDKDNTLVVAVVQTCYSTIHRTNSAIGKMIAATTRRKYGAFIQSPAFDLLVQAFPVFAADIVLSCKQDGPHVFNARTEKCEHCDEMNMVSMIGKNDKRALKGKCWNCERVLTMPARS